MMRRNDSGRLLKALLAMTPRERMSMLSHLVMMEQRNGDGLVQIKGLIEIIGRMTRGAPVPGFSGDERVRAANCLRDLADTLEHQPSKVGNT